MRSKDKKIIDRYIEKHPNATPEKIQKYAESKGIYVDVMPQVEHKKLKSKIERELGIKNLDLDKQEDQIKMLEAIKNLSDEKKEEFLSIKDNL